MKDMRERVRGILEREIARLEDKSADSGLGLTDVKVLDLLIKAANSFAAPSEDPTTASPEAASTEELLNGILDSEKPV